MDHHKQSRLESAGWRVGDAADFLGLTPAEVALIEIRRALSDALRTLRVRKRWTQTVLANRLGSSQSRIAKMEAADATVSIDLLVHGLLAAGATRQDVARAIAAVA